MSDWRINEGSRHPVVLTLGDVEHCMTVARAMALVASAPKLAGAWEQIESRPGEQWQRRGAGGSSVAYAAGGAGAWWRAYDGPVLYGDDAASLAAAKAAADAALREAGWVLDDGDARKGE